MKNKNKLLLAALLLLAGCAPPPVTPLDQQKYDHILAEFTRLRLEYEIFSQEPSPGSQYLLDSLAARHQVNRAELMSQIAEKNPELYRFLPRHK
ncbi:MAG: hypothetical protein ACYTFG_21510 [Planctomycetota bacterium]|jgi:hypothetical protein